MSKSVLVYGGCGALGRAVVRSFLAAGHTVTSVDTKPSEDATASIIVSGSLTEQGAKVMEELKEPELDAVLCVAGGWAGGDAKSSELLSSTERMLGCNLMSAVVASHVAATKLSKGGLLVLTGAQAALFATPGMIGYGISKAATHHLIASLAVPGQLPEDASVLGLLPSTLDTPTNRAGMPTADFSTWTPVDEVASTLLGWVEGSVPAKSGSLMQFTTVGGKTTVSAA